MLISHMNALISEIHWGIPRVQKSRLTLICREYDVYSALEAVPKENNSEVAAICVCDDSWKSYAGSRLKESQDKFANLGIPVLPGKRVAHMPHTWKAAYVPKASRLSFAEVKHAHVRIRRFMLRYGFLSYAIYSDAFESMRLYRPPRPRLYERYQDELEQTYAALETEEDRDTFARYVKASISGDIGYLREKQAPAYYHTNAPIVPGDVIVDAGISSDITNLSYFSDLTGPKGKVFGFEPDGTAYNNACQAVKTKGMANITLVNSGLWDSDGEVLLQTDGCPTIVRQNGKAASSLMDISSKTPAALCSVTRLDSFVAEHTIQKVDMIKMDIEGAELEALNGAKNTIARHSPTLLICLYHEPEHLFQIPLLIKQWQPKYKLYLNQESWLTKELLLIASMRD